MGGVGSSTMELIGVTLLRVLRVPFIQNGQEPLLFQVDGFFFVSLGLVDLVARYFAMIKLSQAWLIHVHAFVILIFLSKGGY